MTEFPISLLQAISDWQRGGDAKQNKRRGEKLKEVSASLPAEYRSCQLICYRQIALEKGGVWDLLGENRLPEKISSWTMDVEVAKAFKGGVPPEEQELRAVIFYLYPPPKTVIVNLSKLYREPTFVKAMEFHKSDISGYSLGAGRYGDAQSEVVLELDVVSPEDVYSMGGHSSPMDQLVAMAADLVYRRPTTATERQDLLLKATRAGVQGGPSWLNMDATRRVLARVKPQAERLAEAKRQQTSSAD